MSYQFAAWASLLWRGTDRSWGSRPRGTGYSFLLVGEGHGDGESLEAELATAIGNDPRWAGMDPLELLAWQTGAQEAALKAGQSLLDGLSPPLGEKEAALIELRLLEV